MLQPIEHVKALLESTKLDGEQLSAYLYSYHGTRNMAVPAAVLNYAGVPATDAFGNARRLALSVRVQLISIDRAGLSKLIRDVLVKVGGDPRVIGISGGSTVALGQEVPVGDQLKNAVMFDVTFDVR